MRATFFSMAIASSYPRYCRACYLLTKPAVDPAHTRQCSWAQRTLRGQPGPEVDWEHCSPIRVGALLLIGAARQPLGPLAGPVNAGWPRPAAAIASTLLHGVRQGQLSRVDRARQQLGCQLCRVAAQLERRGRHRSAAGRRPVPEPGHRIGVRAAPALGEPGGGLPVAQHLPAASRHFGGSACAGRRRAPGLRVVRTPGIMPAAERCGGWRAGVNALLGAEARHPAPDAGARMTWR